MPPLKTVEIPNHGVASLTSVATRHSPSKLGLCSRCSRCSDPLIDTIKEGENIERALKKVKRKFEKTGVVEELRERQKFTKPSVINRERMQKAIYVQHLRQQELDK